MKNTSSNPGIRHAGENDNRMVLQPLTPTTIPTYFPYQRTQNRCSALEKLNVWNMKHLLLTYSFSYSLIHQRNSPRNFTAS